MASITFYPDPNPGTTSCNARLGGGQSGTWSVARAAAAGDPPDYTANETVLQSEGFSSTSHIIYRNLFLFDTSALGSGATVTGAVFSIMSDGTGSTAETTYPANGALVGCTPSSNTAPVAADFAQVGTTRLCDTDITLSAFIATAHYSDWTLNATGLAAVAKTGITKLALRASNDFSDATEPTARSYGSGYFANTTGTANDPKLVITYTASSGAVLTGTGADVVTATGALSAQINLSGEAAEIATATGSLTNDILLAGNASDIASASGELTAQVTLTGAALNLASAGGTLSTSIELVSTRAFEYNAGGFNTSALNGEGAYFVNATLSLLQQDQSLNAQAVNLVTAALSITQANNTPVAAIVVLTALALNLTQQNNSLAATVQEVIAAITQSSQQNQVINSSVTLPVVANSVIIAQSNSGYSTAKLGVAKHLLNSQLTPRNSNQSLTPRVIGGNLSQR